MEIQYDPQFIKQLKKSPRNIQVAFRNRLDLFINNKYHPLLRNHQLKGLYHECRSISITGDWRAILKEIDDEIILFIDLGTHSQLYK